MKKRLCFLVDSIFTFGGVQRVTSVISKTLSSDYDITILTLDKPEQQDLAIYDLQASNLHFRFMSFPPLPPRKRWLTKAYSYLFRRWLPQTRWTSRLYAHSSFPAEKRMPLVRELQEGRYDIIVGVHAPLAVRLASCRRYLPGVRLIGWIHNSYQALFAEGSRYAGPELRRHFEYQLETLDDTVVLCQHDAQQFSFPTRVIYNPLTLQPAAPSKGTSQEFLAVGRFTPQHKGFDLLIEAFRLFSQKNDTWTLTIVGEGPEGDIYQNLIKQYGLDQRITIHPFTHDIQRYYSAAQVYVLSSRWEGMPLVLMEAMAHGLPVVASDLPVCREIMGDFALYFPTGSVEQLAQQLDAATRIDFQQRTAQALAIASHYNVESIVRQWRELLG